MHFGNNIGFGTRNAYVELCLCHLLSFAVPCKIRAIAMCKTQRHEAELLKSLLASECDNACVRVVVMISRVHWIFGVAQVQAWMTYAGSRIQSASWVQ